MTRPWNEKFMTRAWNEKFMIRPWKEKFMIRPWNEKFMKRAWNEKFMTRAWNEKFIIRPWKEKFMIRPWNESSWQGHEMKGHLNSDNYSTSMQRVDNEFVNILKLNFFLILYFKYGKCLRLMCTRYLK